MIYTKSGDTGNSTLNGGTVVSKDSLRIKCLGSIDEANCSIGMTAVKMPFGDIKTPLRHLQQQLFVIGAELGSDSIGLQNLPTRIIPEDTEYLESLIDKIMSRHGPVKGFMVPGDSEFSTLLHAARNSVRRAERYIVALSKEEDVSPEILAYVNRLSDTLYAMAYAVFCRECAKE